MKKKYIQLFGKKFHFELGGQNYTIIIKEFTKDDFIRFKEWNDTWISKKLSSITINLYSNGEFELCNCQPAIGKFNTELIIMYDNYNIIKEEEKS